MDFSRTDLLLPMWIMHAEKYQLPIFGHPPKEGFRSLKNVYQTPTASSPMFSVDCEMCITTAGQELAKVALIDEHLEPVFSILVKPEHEIVDYLTEYSGITPEMMTGDIATLADVQDILKWSLVSDAILVGHALGNDLKALKIYHPFVIDTSIIFNDLSGKKQKLRDLVASYLNKDIQTQSGGHCPIEDATAAMQLVKLRLARGVFYGDAVLSATFEGKDNLGRPRYTSATLRTMVEERKINLPCRPCQLHFETPPKIVFFGLQDEEASALVNGRVKELSDVPSLPSCIFCFAPLILNGSNRSLCCLGGGLIGVGPMESDSARNSNGRG